MLYNKREELSKPFDDPSYVSGYNSGIFLFKYSYDSATDLLFKDRMYDNIRVQVANNKYFFLENISTEIMTLQRVTFMQDNTSYIRSIMKEGNVSPDFDGIYNREGYIYSKWELESLKENDSDVRQVLDTASKSSMHQRLLSKNDTEYKKVFKYKKRITVSDLNTILENGIYTVIDDIETLFSLMPMRREILKRRANSKNMQDTSLEGVLENYNTENHIYQTFYISSPIVANMNRYYNKSSNKWSEWRINQNVDDTYWLHNAIPVSNYADIPIIKRQLGINSTMLVYQNNGNVNEEIFPRNLESFSVNKDNSFSTVENVFYKVGSRYPVDMVYGYNSERSINYAEKLDNIYDDYLYNPSQVMSAIGRELNHWGGKVAYMTDVPVDKRSKEELYKGWTIGPNNTNYLVRNNLDKSNDGRSYVIPSFSYINGLSIYWSTDIMHFDVKQGLVVDFNNRKDTI